MNEETKKAVEALSGGSAGTKSTEGTDPKVDYKAECEKLQKQLQGERVETGRLKKANEENAALRKRLEELEARMGAEEAYDALPDRLKEELPDDYKQGAAALAKHMVDKANAERDAKLKEMEERLAQDEERRRVEAMGNFIERIKATYPGFTKSVSEGGDKQEAWIKYQQNNAESINAALADGNFKKLSYHIERFYSSLGLDVPSGNRDETAAPEPRAIGGGDVAHLKSGTGKTYTVEEWKRTMDEAQTKHQSGQLSSKDYSAICAELTKAYQEGRVK